MSVAELLSSGPDVDGVVFGAPWLSVWVGALAIGATDDAGEPAAPSLDLSSRVNSTTVAAASRSNALPHASNTRVGLALGGADGLVIALERRLAPRDVLAVGGFVSGEISISSSYSNAKSISNFVSSA
jgi:hypothetical protein